MFVIYVFYVLIHIYRYVSTYVFIYPLFIYLCIYIFSGAGGGGKRRAIIYLANPPSRILQEL